MNLNKLMKQAQKMQEQMAKTQAELEDKTVEVQAAGGKVTVVANGAGDVVSIKIAKEIVDPEDVEFLEEAVLSGVKQAIEQAKELGSSEMAKITGGLGAAGLGLSLAWHLKLLRHEDAIRVLRVIRERPASGEAGARVELPGRRERFHRSRLHTQPPITAPSGFRDDVIQHRLRHAFPQMPRRGPHRLDLALPRVEFLERAAAEKLAAFHALQKVISGRRNSSIGKACTLSGGD